MLRSPTKPQDCFVIMPFGQKPLPNGRIYDFEKVYRVLIERAVTAVGMRPLRADQTPGSHLIHEDMFRDLRDRAVVLADLSLENANVFYELGIRHVMVPSGTILMCREGTTLPFDISPSRTILYEFDGECLDWEIAERTVEKLKAALKDVANNQLDSPVHALLTHVSRFNDDRFGLRDAPTHALGDPSFKYQQDLADGWLAGDFDTETLLREHMHNDFGLRALGYYFEKRIDAAEGAARVAGQLSMAAHHDLAMKIYKKLDAAGKLNGKQLLQFAATCAECYPDSKHVDTAISYVERLLPRTEDPPPPVIETIGLAYARLGSLLQKKWNLSEDSTCLAQAIEAYNSALRHMEEQRNKETFALPGMIAHTRLKLLTLWRKSNPDLKRQDPERHREEILKIPNWDDDDPVSVSYLHWAKAIALADLGRAGEADKIVARRLLEDERKEIRQYRTIWEFLDRYQDVWNNVGVISRQLSAVLR
jgi:tetratricopeptide (TPR) repeat protein